MASETPGAVSEISAVRFRIQKIYDFRYAIFELRCKKESERRPRSPATHRGSRKNFVGEEAPEARTSAPLSIDSRLRSPNVFCRVEEAGAAQKNLTDNSEMEALSPKHSNLTVTEI